jgi:hypothetical protein
MHLFGITYRSNSELGGALVPNEIAQQFQLGRGYSAGQILGDCMDFVDCVDCVD